MPDTKSELNDIILNKSHNTFGGFKKVLFAVASFMMLFVLVIVVMSSMDEKPANSLAKTILPPEPNLAQEQNSELFKSVEITNEGANDEQARLEAIANEIKQQTLNPSEKTPKEDEVVVTSDDVVTIDDPYVTVTEPDPVVVKKEIKKTVVKKDVKKVVKTTTKKSTLKGQWYVQVGSFEKVKPHERLIAKIKRMGYNHKIYKSKVDGQRLTKLLIGPYTTYKNAQQAKPKIAREIEAAAFIYQVVK
jgi:DedD protein